MCTVGGPVAVVAVVAYPRIRIMPSLWLGIIIVVAWAFMWLGLKVATGMIHLLAVIGLALVIWGLVKRGARAIT